MIVYLLTAFFACKQARRIASPAQGAEVVGFCSLHRS